MTMGAVAVRVGLSIWLVTLAVVDLRKEEVTNWATVPPLIALTVWRSVTGGWPLGLTLALVLIGAQWPSLAVPSLGSMALCACLAVPMGLDVAVWVWIFVYLLWETGVVGGADAKAVMALMALFPDGTLAWLLLLCWFGLSVVYLVRRHGRRVPRVLLRALRGLAKGRMPEEGIRYPALPAVALASLVYVWAW